MARWMRLGARCAVLLLLGAALTAAAFTFARAVRSDAVLAGLAGVLFVGNFLVLRRGVARAHRPIADLSVDVSRFDRPRAVTTAP